MMSAWKIGMLFLGATLSICALSCATGCSHGKQVILDTEYIGFVPERHCTPCHSDMDGRAVLDKGAYIKLWEDSRPIKE